MPLVFVPSTSADLVKLQVETFPADVSVLNMFSSCYYLKKGCIYSVGNTINGVNMSLTA